MKKFIAFTLIFIFILSGCSNQPAETGIDLYGTYDKNDLLIDSITESYNDVEINIPVIKGLKDESVQDKINSEMHSMATALIEKYSSINYANYYTRANFANVISISFSVGFDEDPYSESIYFNYNLVDGSKLNLEDLFTSDANLIDIIRSAVYNEMAIYGGYDRDTYVHYPAEEKIYKIVKGYLETENKQFAFSPSGIYLYPKNQFAEVKMIDYADDIVIYSKYMTKESVFTGEYEGFKNIFTCADTQYDLFDVIEYGYMENNLWYDFTVGTTYIPFDDPPSDERREKFEAFTKQSIENERAKLDAYREQATENPDKFYIVLSKPSFHMDIDSDYENGKWHYTYHDTAKVNTHIQLFEMPLDLYETVYKDKIIETYRYEFFAMRGGAWLDTENTEGAKFTETTNTTTHNYMED